MAADIDQEDFVLGDLQGHGDAVAVGDADGLQTLKLAGVWACSRRGSKGSARSRSKVSMKRGPRGC